MSRPRAFTLIELLVVVSIMALLIGLLLPVLGSARAAGRGSVCLSNIRQLVIANTAYATDHDDRFVPGAADFMSNLDRWHGGRDNFSQPFDPRRGPLWDYLRPAETRACPEFVAERDFTAGFEAGNGGYGYNLDYVGRDTLDAVEALTTRLGAQAHWFANPTETIVFADAAFATFGPTVIEYSFVHPPKQVGSSSPYDPATHFRHGDATHAGWLDGRATSHRLILSRPNIYGVSEAQHRELGIGWFGPNDNSLFDRN